MNIEKLRIKRNLYFKISLLNYIMLIIGYLFYIIFTNFTLKVCNVIFGYSKHTALAIFGMFGMMEILIVVFFLVPAIAFHWQYCSLKKQEKQNK